jgi:hypothetical protein
MGTLFSMVSILLLLFLAANFLEAFVIEFRAHGGKKTTPAEAASNSQLFEICHLPGLGCELVIQPDPASVEILARENLVRFVGRTMKLVVRGTNSNTCPDCGGNFVHRSRRKDFVETFMHLFLFISPYRCLDCNERHFRFRFSNASTSSPAHKDASKSKTDDDVTPMARSL